MPARDGGARDRRRRSGSPPTATSPLVARDRAEQQRGEVLAARNRGCRTRRRPRRRGRRGRARATVPPASPRTCSAELAGAAGSRGARLLERRPDDQPHELVVVELGDGRSATRRPSRSTTTRSARSRTSSRRCETKTTPAPRAATRRTAVNRRPTSSPCSAAVGSSRIEQAAGVAPAVQRAGDRDDRPFRRRQPAHRDRDVEVRVELAQEFPRVLGLLAAPGGKRRAGAEAPAEVEVLDGVQWTARGPGG